MFEEWMFECVRCTQTPLGLIREKLLDKVERVPAFPPHLDGRQIREEPSQVHRRDFDECHLLSVRELFECLGREHQ